MNAQAGYNRAMADAEVRLRSLDALHILEKALGHPTAFNAYAVIDDLVAVMRGENGTITTALPGVPWAPTTDKE